MLLKGLEIQGFKSFPDKINISFNDGITAIVGPNGSGKSNIADAVRWVMGEQSTKTLRGVKMEDVVFDGTSDRKPLGFAEVSLTIDNSDKGLQSEYNEITVTRKYFRSGESEYFINKTPVRLKDINEMFMDTGLGRDGYSIIGQGRIAEILSVKSEERRQIFEEAVGISKYRYRKVEAERRLLSTEDNLCRLRDIVTELEERIRPLKEQSDKARKFLDLREEKKSLEVNVWLDGIDKIKDGIKKLEEDCEYAKLNLEEADRVLAKTEKDIDESYEATKTHSSGIDNIRNEMKTIEEEVSSKEALTAVLKNDLSHNEDKVLRLRDELSNDSNKANEIDLQIDAKNTSILLLSKAVEDLEAQLNHVLLHSEMVSQSAVEVNSQIESLRNEISSKTSLITDLKIKESYLNSNIEGSAIRANEINENFIQRQENFEKALLDKEQTDNRIKEQEEKQSSINNIISGYNLKLATKESKTFKSKQKRDELTLKYNEKSNKINLLSDMEKHYEGFFGSVKAVMDESIHGGLKGILGPVSSLIKVKDEYSLAIETVLGNAIQNIVTINEDNAKIAINFLKSSGSGRATFLPLSSIKGTVISESDISNNSGFIGLASNLIDYEAKYDEIIKSLLGRTVVVEYLDNAIALSKKTNYRYRIVTLDGQIINAGGSMTGGSTVKNAGVLSRVNQIAKLKEELIIIKKELETIENELKANEIDLASSFAYIDGANAEFRVLEEELIKDRTSLTHYELLIANIKTSIEDINKEKSMQSTQINEWNNELNKVREEILIFEKDEKLAEDKLFELSGNQATVVKDKEKLSLAISEKKMEIISVKKDIEAALSVIDELNSQKNEQNLSLERKEQEINEILASKEQIDGQINLLLYEVVLLKNSLVEKQNQIAGVSELRLSAEKRITELRQSEKSAIELKNKLTAVSERLEGRKANIQIEYDGFIARLWDEYELTLSEAEKLRTQLESKTNANKRINEIKSSIKTLGDVNVSSIEEYKLVKDRYEFLTVQVTDLIKAKSDLEKIIFDLTEQMRGIFSNQFKVINSHFSITFKELFGGGTAELVLNDPSDVLSSGIEIIVAPPGKIIKHLSALSGGEQAFVAIALYFAILKVKPTPFCVLDEIEAALDEVNVVRFAEYLRKLTKGTQFIAITHRRGTMEEADMLYGVTMQEKGVSKMLAINVNEIEKHLKIWLGEFIMGFYEKLKEGLTKTRGAGMNSSLNDLFKNFRKVDEEFLEELEEILIMGDVGVETSSQIIDKLRDTAKSKKNDNSEMLKEALTEIISEVMFDENIGIKINNKPAIILVIGVNGVGKTTTIAKLANNFKKEGKKVILGAADTFRAAAIEQLEIWANRVGVDIIKHKEGSDPAAVIFDTIKAGKARFADVIICDTAGRLHNKKHLMDELSKISKIIERELPNSDRETLLVLDATTGQNALNQAKEFKACANITGIVLTKLDGTARGGMVISIKNELGIPVKYIGIGEKMDDLQPFNPTEYARALIE